jgi:two-component system CheB/CheR fusion protein
MKKRRTSTKASTGAGSLAAGPSAHLPIAVVGIGASAGGLEAVTALLRGVPPHSGMAFVVIQHLDPTHGSALPALLQRATVMPVTEATHGMPVEANCVYVIPPNRTLRVEKRRIKVSPRAVGHQIHLPVDSFLESLAAEEAERGVGVILSGNGSDGTRGALAVKAAGGVTFAQDETSAKYTSMPANAVAAGCIDFVMTPEAIAKKLVRLAGQPVRAAKAKATAVPRPRTEEQAFGQIVALLRQRCAVDFTHYKRATIDRRIQRRMGLRNIESLRRYAEYLRLHAAETQELFNDILIHVTGFFRDARVFPLLKKKVFPRLLKGRHPEAPLRIWVAGCSSGEEVYSLAMVLMEFLAERRAPFPVQLFGTDISLAALERARAGFYPAGIAADVSQERLRRFFTKSDGGYRINKSIREQCVFARQNLVADPPFSNLDLISCRNVLIYLGPELQRKVFPVFHYALQPNGFLLLGALETTGAHGALFEVVDKRARIYTRKPVLTRPVVPLGFLSALKPEAPAAGVPGGRGMPALAEIQRQADRVMLAHYSPPGVVVNRDMEVLQFRGHTGPYLEHAHGEASLSLFKMAREGLAVDLRAVVAKAMRQDGPARQEAVHLKQNGGVAALAIEAVPFNVPPSQERFLLITFEAATGGVPVTGGRIPAARQGRAAGRPAESPELARLREEVSGMRESLQATIEEQEATNEELRSANEEILSSNEELRSANEEILSSNEELQSTNEELETAKEEMQSTNEELTTLNDELETRNTEMERVTNDIHNLMASVQIPIVMVGPDLCIRRFTTIAERTLNLTAGDIGRPLGAVNFKMTVPGLAKHVADVIDSLQTRELEFKDQQGHWWSVRIRPYRTTDHKIDGAVVAFVDIDVLKMGMERTTTEREYAEALINTVHEPVVAMDHNLVVEAANKSFFSLFKVRAEDALNRRIYELGDGQWNIPKLRSLLEDILPHNAVFQDFPVEHTFPSIGRKRMLLNARRLVRGDNKTALILLAIEDVTAKVAR